MMNSHYLDKLIEMKIEIEEDDFADDVELDTKQEISLKLDNENVEMLELEHQRLQIPEENITKVRECKTDIQDAVFTENSSELGKTEESLDISLSNKIICRKILGATHHIENEIENKNNRPFLRVKRLKDMLPCDDVRLKKSTNQKSPKHKPCNEKLIKRDNLCEMKEPSSPKINHRIVKTWGNTGSWRIKEQYEEKIDDCFAEIKEENIEITKSHIFAEDSEESVFYKHGNEFCETHINSEQGAFDSCESVESVVEHKNELEIVQVELEDDTQEASQNEVDEDIIHINDNNMETIENEMEIVKDENMIDIQENEIEIMEDENIIAVQENEIEIIEDESVIDVQENDIEIIKEVNIVDIGENEIEIIEDRLVTIDSGKLNELPDGTKSQDNDDRVLKKNKHKYRKTKGNSEYNDHHHFLRVNQIRNILTSTNAEMRDDRKRKSNELNWITKAWEDNLRRVTERLFKKCDNMEIIELEDEEEEEQLAEEPNKINKRKGKIPKHRLVSQSPDEELSEITHVNVSQIQNISASNNIKMTNIRKRKNGQTRVEDVAREYNSKDSAKCCNTLEIQLEMKRYVDEINRILRKDTKTQNDLVSRSSNEEAIPEIISIESDEEYRDNNNKKSSLEIEIPDILPDNDTRSAKKTDHTIKNSFSHWKDEGTCNRGRDFGKGNSRIPKTKQIIYISDDETYCENLSKEEIIKVIDERLMQTEDKIEDAMEKDRKSRSTKVVTENVKVRTSDKVEDNKTESTKASVANSKVKKLNNEKDAKNTENGTKSSKMKTNIYKNKKSKFPRMGFKENVLKGIVESSREEARKDTVGESKIETTTDKSKFAHEFTEPKKAEKIGHIRTNTKKHGIRKVRHENEESKCLNEVTIEDAKLTEKERKRLVPKKDEKIGNIKADTKKSGMKRVGNKNENSKLSTTISRKDMDKNEESKSLHDVTTEDTFKATDKRMVPKKDEKIGNIKTDARKSRMNKMEDKNEKCNPPIAVTREEVLKVIDKRLIPKKDEKIENTKDNTGKPISRRVTDETKEKSLHDVNTSKELVPNEASRLLKLQNMRTKSEVMYCIYCSYHTGIKRYLAQHVKTRHTLKNHNSNINRTVCDICGRSVTRKHLTDHKKRHGGEEILHCNDCKYHTNVREYLIKHISNRHASHTVIKCTHCAYETRQNYLFKRHMKRHEDNKSNEDFKREQCSYSTNRRSNLKRHVRENHQNVLQTLQKCQFCPYMSRWASNLYVHVKNRHSEMNNFEIHKCKECSFETRWLSHLYKHKKDKHMKNAKVILQKCTECKFETKHLSHLYKHRKIAHS